MNEEYLWSKKGSDPEIEQLETLLSEFRFVRRDVPVGVIETPAAAAGFFSHRFAWIFGLATPSFALALFVFWLFNSNPGGESRVRQGIFPPPVIRNESVSIVPVSAAVDEENVRPVSPIKKAGPRVVRTVYRPRKPRTGRLETLTAMRLTSEEKYAYDRLMLALSIAGRKLKVVQDTIDRSEESEKRSNEK